MSMSTTDIEAGDRRPEKYQLLPELPPEQFEALKADIAERGVVVPVVMDEFGAILDGHNRARACRELGINDYPVEVRRGLSEPEKRAVARNLNALRRHLTREQVRSLIADQLRDTPEWSNRRIAGGLGVDDKTVASVRAGLVATAEFPQLDKTVGADGKARRAPPLRRRKNHSSPLAADEFFLDDEDDEADEAVAPDQKQDKARRREEREQRRADKEWEAIGATAEKRAKFEHAIDLVKMGVDPNSEKVAKLMREASLVTFETSGYDMFANCTEDEKREWHVFLLFLVKREGAAVDGGVAEHIEWILQRQFKTVEEWLGPGGKKLPAKYIEIWRVFAAEHAGMTIADIGAELDRIRAYQKANPHPPRAAVARLPDSPPPAT
jgi:ParB-like chromosome segregation protein Spo0J